MTVLKHNDKILESVIFPEGKAVFRLKDKWSALTHIFGFLASIIGMPLLLIKASRMADSSLSLISFAVFMLSMILLYGASSAYHSFNISPSANILLKKTDHMSIFILIAGTYTPVCTILMNDIYGKVLLTVIWSIAAAGILFKACWVTCPKWVSSVMYTMMGWTCIAVLPHLLSVLDRTAFLWLLAGGLFYTIGAFFYAAKPRIFRNPEFGPHEIFHCFVLAGSLCHYILMFSCLTAVG